MKGSLPLAGQIVEGGCTGAAIEKDAVSGIPRDGLFDALVLDVLVPEWEKSLKTGWCTHGCHTR